MPCERLPSFSRASTPDDLEAALRAARPAGWPRLEHRGSRRRRSPAEGRAPGARAGRDRRPRRRAPPPARFPTSTCRASAVASSGRPSATLSASRPPIEPASSAKRRAWIAILPRRRVLAHALGLVAEGAGARRGWRAAPRPRSGRSPRRRRCPRSARGRRAGRARPRAGRTSSAGFQSCEAGQRQARAPCCGRA